MKKWNAPTLNEMSINETAGGGKQPNATDGTRVWTYYDEKGGQHDCSDTTYEKNSSKN